MGGKYQAPVRTGMLDFLKNSVGCQFIIPVYQRNYTWTAAKEVKQYLEDLENILDKKQSNHFLGIIIYLDKTIDFATREFSVIDGQQRLTTTFLILYAIRALMKEQNEQEKIKKLEGQFLTNPFASNKGIKYKLKPLVADDETYKYIVDDEIEKIESKSSRIYKNYIYILNYLRKLNQDKTLNEILLALNELYIVCIPLSDDDNAQKIFESINATGVKLTASDLIRNFLLMGLESDEQEKYYKDYWLELEKNLTDDSKKLESFFRFYLAIKNKTLPNKNAVYREFVDWYNAKDVKREVIFEDIIKYSSFYYEIYNRNINEMEIELRKPIREFRRILSDMPAPLLMEFYNLYQLKRINSSQLASLIYVINNYLIRRALCDIDTSGITRLFPPLLKDVEEECGGNYKNVVEVLKKNLVFKNINNSMFVPDDKQLYDIIINSNIYKIKGALRIFLDKLEHDNNPAPVDLSELSVEHLMPQTPTIEWYNELGVDEDVYQRNINRLGNLTLAAKVDNSKMKNKVWEYKNSILKSTSHLIINQKILEKERWTIEEIENRTVELIAEINRLFPYPKSDDTMLRIEEIFINNNGVKASANFYVDNGDVEIFEGSELYDMENSDNYSAIEDLRKELIEEGIVFDSGEKKVFKKSYIVNSKTKTDTALSSSASLILHGSRNGWNCWTNRDGKPLSEVGEIARKYNK